MNKVDAPRSRVTIACTLLGKGWHVPERSEGRGLPAHHALRSSGRATQSSSLLLLTILALVPSAPVQAAEFHVASSGKDSNAGTLDAPLRTIQRAADLAQPGDTITVHEGVYRERITPPRGGEFDTKRIVYQAAPGEKVEIKGSEVVKDWVKVQNETWKVTLPNSFFGAFNPYSDLIHGDWFAPLGRQHHTGAVYLNGEWLVEAARLGDVLLPVGAAPPPFARSAGQYLLNVAWLRPDGGSGRARRIPATAFAAKKGTQNAPCSEGGECIGFIEHGHWVRYERIDFEEAPSGSRSAPPRHRKGASSRFAWTRLRENSWARAQLRTPAAGRYGPRSMRTSSR